MPDGVRCDSGGGRSKQFICGPALTGEGANGASSGGAGASGRAAAYGREPGRLSYRLRGTVGGRPAREASGSLPDSSGASPRNVLSGTAPAHHPPSYLHLYGDNSPTSLGRTGEPGLGA